MKIIEEHLVKWVIWTLILSIPIGWFSWSISGMIDPQAYFGQMDMLLSMAKRIMSTWLYVFIVVAGFDFIYQKWGKRNP
ncbi:MAG: hypothetical protein MRZ79_23895 [Bacteroidia bacterium]|nr:hypothetical protein [Bacteroidia bacterium]